MTKHPPTHQQRKPASAPQVAAKLPRTAVAAQRTSVPRQNHPATLLGKTAVIARVAERSGASVKESSAIINATLETIREALTRGDVVRLTGFGSFGVRTRAAHRGVNPQTRARMQVPAKQRVRFSAGKGLSDAVAR
jgi:DNA-binding protein HU-beta